MRIHITLAVDPDRYGTPTIDLAVIVHHVYPSGNVTWRYVDDTGVEWTWAREVTRQLEDMAHAGELVRVAA